MHLRQQQCYLRLLVFLTSQLSEVQYLNNTCCVYGPDGKLKAKHRKIHLFDINIPRKITFKESETLAAGETPTVVDTEVGRIGIGICYDIRFQELAMLYAARGFCLFAIKSLLLISSLSWKINPF